MLTIRANPGLKMARIGSFCYVEKGSQIRRGKPNSAIINREQVKRISPLTRTSYETALLLIN